MYLTQLPICLSIGGCYHMEISAFVEIFCGKRVLLSASHPRGHFIRIIMVDQLLTGRLPLTYPQRKQSQGVRSGDLAGQLLCVPLPIHL
ncbi:hypothetical protein HUJ05_006596 [Dendroctonus ponderosae]|nr:hypothetical protein HUJ05_006596 [Dendroctonus ponderosae]